MVNCPLRLLISSPIIIRGSTYCPSSNSTSHVSLKCFHLFSFNVQDAETINSFELANKITNIETYNKGLMLTTENELYLWNTEGVVEGFPIASDGYFNIADIDNNGKQNLINTKNGFIYNYELADYSIK